MNSVPGEGVDLRSRQERVEGKIGKSRVLAFLDVVYQSSVSDGERLTYRVIIYITITVR